MAFHESHNLARYIARAHIRALLACAQDDVCKGLHVGACGAGLHVDFTANYARRTTAPRRDGLRPRGCWLVLLRSM